MDFAVYNVYLFNIVLMLLQHKVLYNGCMRDAIGSIKERADTAISRPSSNRNRTDGVISRGRSLFQKL